ncbi:discoidin domain-containing protein [Catelliglobosispora koreensis]|uniref:discoidin domain-containing protein n=1 Tax=Catelliglobosispora koreensis TaxID=129052 RepID=UPI0003A13987
MQGRNRRITAAVAAVLAAAAVTVTAVLVSASPATAAGVPARSYWNIPGRGATVPFAEHEAEYQPTNGTLVGPDRYYTTLASEASGRQAITLDAVGEYVEFTLSAPANAMAFRYSIPDGNGGAGRDAAIDVRVNGNVLKSVPVTSRFGWYYGGYPFNNNPGDTNPHHFYDQVRTLFGTTYPTGTKIRLQVASTAQSPSFTIDLADFENVAGPIAKPTNAIDVVADFGADPTGGTADQTAKFQAAVNAGQAQGREVYIPAGKYTLWDHVVVDQVTLRGAGMWHSELKGRHPTDRKRAVGVYGKYVNGGGYTGEIRPHEGGGPSRNVTLKDFAIIGDIRERDDDFQVNAIGGAMTDSVIERVWMENTKCGAWMDGPMDNLIIRDSVIVDQIADGVNFHVGVTDSAVTNTFVRNTGDDGLAMWAQSVPNERNKFNRNTVVQVILANNIVTYGGRDIEITDNVTADSLTNGGGIHVANRYPGVNGPTAVQGVTTVARNTLVRNGNSDYNWQFGVGAIWFSGLNEPINATVNVTDTDIFDSSYAALMWIEGQTRTVNFTNVRIDGAGTYALQIQSPGAATFTNVTATNIAQGPDNLIHNCVGSGFTITQGSGNSGWFDSTPYCGPWHTPNWGTPTPPTTPPTSNPPSQGQLQLSQSSLIFGTQNIGTTSAAQTVTVTNPSSTAVNISGIAASGDFARTTTCGATLNAGASCVISVTFTPTVSGTRSGQLSIGSDAQGNPHIVNLSGTGFDPAGNLAQGKPASATSQNGPYSPANAVDGDASTYWESANNAWPQSITVDLLAAYNVNRAVVKLPPPAAWGPRTQTFSVHCSTNGSTYSQVVAPAGHAFNPATGNSVSLSFPSTSCRQVRLTFTGNTGWPAAQVSEFEVYAGGQPPVGPQLSLSASSLAFGNQAVNTTSAPQNVTVTNTGNGAASLGAINVTGNFARTTTCGATLNAGASCSVAVTFTPTSAGTKSGTVSFTSNASGSPHTVNLSGNGTVANTNLALNRPTTESGHVQNYGSGNAVDGNQGSYWESLNNAWPQTITVDLGASTTVGRVVLKLPTNWGDRNQTLSILGSATGSMFTTVQGSAQYTFSQAAGNVVTITFSQTSQRFIRLSFTANTGWPAGQVSEFEVYAS